MIEHLNRTHPFEIIIREGRAFAMCKVVKSHDQDVISNAVNDAIRIYADLKGPNTTVELRKDGVVVSTQPLSDYLPV